MQGPLCQHMRDDCVNMRLVDTFIADKMDFIFMGFLFCLYEEILFEFYAESKEKSTGSNKRG